MAGRFTVETIFKAIDKMTLPIRKMQTSVKTFTKKAGKSMAGIRRATDKMTAGFKKFVFGVVAGGAIIAAVLANITLEGANFEQQLTNAAAKFGFQAKQGVKEYDDITAAARKMGATTEFTAIEAAEALNKLAQAGFDVETAILSLPTILDLATAAEVDMAEAARIGTKSLGAFGLMSADATVQAANLAKVTDILAKTATSSNTSLIEMFDALKMGAPIARAAGITMKDTALLIATLADAGIDATLAGTALRQLSFAIGAPGSEASQILKWLGVQTTTIKAGVRETKNIFEIFADLKEKIGRKDQAIRLPILQKLFKTRGSAAAGNVMAAMGTALERLKGKFEDVTGAAGRMAAQMRGTMLARMKILKSVFTDLKLEIHEVTKGPIDDFIMSMTAWLRLNNKLIAAKIGGFINFLIENKRVLSVVAAGVLVLTIAFAGLIIALKLYILWQTAANIAMVANPVGAIVVAIALLVLWFFALIAVVVLFREKFLQWFADLGIVGQIIAVLVGGPLFLLALAAAFLIEHWDEFIAFFTELWQQLKNMFFNIMDWFEGLGIIGKILAMLVGGPLFLFAIAAKFIVDNWEPLKDFFVLFFDGIVEGFNFVKKGLKDLIQFILDDPILQKLFELGEFFGDILFKENEKANRAKDNAPATVSDAERNSRSVHENNNNAEVTIKTEKGTTAEVTDGNVGPNIKLIDSGTT